jgi:hypothetical protein
MAERGFDCPESSDVCQHVKYQVRGPAGWLERYRVIRITCDGNQRWAWHTTTLKGARKMTAKQIRKDERDRRRGKLRWYLRRDPLPPLPPVIFEAEERCE